LTHDRSRDALPPAAEARIAEIRGSGTWGSVLSTAEFAAIRGVGFEPAGQVLGAAVYNIGYSGGYGCPGAWAGLGVSANPFRSVTRVSSQDGYSSFSALVRAMYSARRAAISRMTAECAELGGHGVVGVLLSIGPFPAGGLEFKAIGTAVRAPGAPPPPQPFTSGLSGQEFAKLIATGWVPAGLVLGISVGARHDDLLTRRQTRRRAGNTEVTGYTELVNDARHDARVQLERDVRARGAEGVVINSMSMRVREVNCPAQEHGRDHLAEVTLVGTAIARFARTAAGHGREHARPREPSLPILSLDPQRRQAARVRLGRTG
jgi:uncharacterized protein YbjQ (UPF0145 family)